MAFSVSVTNNGELIEHWEFTRYEDTLRFLVGWDLNDAELTQLLESGWVILDEIGQEVLHFVNDEMLP